MDASSICSGSGCKKLKVNEDVNAADDDRISALHDMVLQQILSFLPTTDAVRTCILSKRFDNMWTSLRNLSFDNPLDVKRDLFMNFVERVLTHRDFSSLHEVSLGLLVYGDAMRITTWISAVIRRKVRVLRITLSDIKASLVLPHCLFKSESLEELDISMPHVLTLPPRICFSSLRMLYLQSVIFPSDHLTQQFFSGCPVLEELEINLCSWENLRAVSISCPRLKRLTISELAKDEGGGGNSCQVMILSTSLEFFDCRGEFRNDYFLSETSSIVHTCLYVWTDGEPERIPEVSYRLHKLMKVLPNITQLELSGSAIEIYGYAKELFTGVPIFKSLTRLEFDMDVVGLDLDGLHTILLNSPHLGCIYFFGGVRVDFGSPEITDQIFTPVPSCFKLHLKLIRVDSFYGREDEVTALKIMLAKAAVLEKMVIGCCLPLKEEVRERLLLLPRSSGCSLVFI